jgi:serine protease Do
MKVFIVASIIFLLLLSCSKPTAFLVIRVINSRTLELEDGTHVNLVGVNKTTSKYLESLNGVTNKYVTLYDENYDPIKEISVGSINAYVYDEQDNCINNFSEGNSEVTEGTNEQIIQSEPIVQPKNGERKSRISGKEIEKYPTSSLSELYTRNKYAVFLIAVPKNETSYAQGTGFFISSTGIGVSNYHVFADGKQDQAIAKTIDNQQYRIKRIIKSDKELDFIVFEVENDHNDFPFLTLAGSQPTVGEDVFAIGNPKGLEHTLSKGIVSSFRDNDNLIQTTTEITHGSSGGPLFNMKGEVIGITTSGVGEANLNFAMNIQKLGIKEIIR